MRTSAPAGSREVSRDAAPAMPHFWLNVHVGYACRDSGACCSAGWPIPIERDRASVVEQGIATGLVNPAAIPWLVPDASAPPEIAGTLALQPDGHCVWHQRIPSTAGICTSTPPATERRCAIHSMRPLSCAHFPYVCLIDARGVHVTLSHYCPTAASMLFDHHGPVEIVEGPPPIPQMALPEGLDARESLPPTRSEARLMSWDEFTAWERDAIASLFRPAPAFAKATEGRPDFRLPTPDSRLELFDLARAAVPPPLSWPEAPPDFEQSWNRLVEPSWNQFDTIVNRYLAAKLFASWAAYLGDGLPDVLRGVEQARAVLQVEAVRQCVRANRVLDAALLKAAIRRSDLLLVHYADRQSLISCTPAS